ncbi:MAG: hypothetical protein O2800_05990 [Planctomycetota bacterium]|nr:hypothetical protein [Planctomycetota bacterium]
MHRILAVITLIGIFLASAATSSQSQEVNPSGFQTASAAVDPWRYAKTIALIPIHGEIDEVVVQSISRRLDAAVQNGADLAVFEINTPGGDLKACLDICALLRMTPIRTVAWIRPHAYSAGAIIALACGAIVVSPGAAFGDAAPIAAIPGLGLQSLSEVERAKIESPVIADVVESARRNGRDERLVERFIRLDRPLFLVEAIDGSARAIADEDELNALGVAPTDGPIPSTVDSDRPLEAWYQSFDQPTNRRASRAAFGPDDVGQWRVIARVTDPKSLLVVHERMALVLGLAEGTASTEEELSAWTGGATITRYDERWSEEFVRWMTSWPVRLILVAVLILCFIAEMLTPGFGAFGLGAFIAFGLLVVAPLVGGMAEWWAGVLVFAGMALVAAEILLVPGTTFVGILGAACFLLGIVGLFVEGDLSTTQGRAQMPAAFAILAGGVALAAVGLWLLSRTTVLTRVWSRGILSSAADDPGVEREFPTQSPPARPAIGQIGVTDTPLGPSGHAWFGTTLVDVVSPTGYLEAGVRVRVVSSDGFVIEVEPCERETA